jgi:hypothetical protein
MLIFIDPFGMAVVSVLSISVTVRWPKPLPVSTSLRVSGNERPQPYKRNVGVES